MVAFKNFLGGIMFVDESRKSEYLSLGYKPYFEEVTHIKSEDVTEDVSDEAPEDVTEDVSDEAPEEVAEAIKEEKPKKTARRKK